VLHLSRRVQAVTSRAERAVLIWGGLRGALTITLALALPAGFPERQLLIPMAFGVVLFTLVVQGITLSLLVRRVGLAEAK
jgi:CPA1 family monovalent cation:H+ antiporter